MRIFSNNCSRCFSRSRTQGLVFRVILRVARYATFGVMISKIARIAFHTSVFTTSTTMPVLD